MSNMLRSSSEFGLHDKLQAGRLQASTDGETLYSATSAPEVDHKAIEYFAASVIWRAAAAEWTLHDGPRRIPLGRYEDGLRRFLLDESGFPADIGLSVTVAESADRQLGAFFPQQDRNADGKRIVEFLIPGIYFHAVFAKHLSALERSMTFSHSSQRYVSGSPKRFDWIRKTLSRLAFESPKKGKLAKQFS